mmetsp:Transcript_3999/g.4912  ORF Transcript_3999/g.4912 Transcript_3999/m.4912 type:complete len:256 (+) Transcript_3999:107-874(+)
MIRGRFDDFPIHHAMYYNTTTELSSSSSSPSSKDAFVEFITMNEKALYTTDQWGVTPLHVLCANPSATTKQLKVLIAANPDALAVQCSGGLSPLMMFASCRNIELTEEGDLPPLWDLLRQGEEKAQEKGQKQGLGLKLDVLEMILEVFDRKRALYLDTYRKEESSRLFPLMLAASLPHCKFEMVYKLAMRCPELLRDHLEQDPLRGKNPRSHGTSGNKSNSNNNSNDNGIASFFKKMIATKMPSKRKLDSVLCMG